MKLIQTEITYVPLVNNGEYVVINNANVLELSIFVLGNDLFRMSLLRRLGDVYTD